MKNNKGMLILIIVLLIGIIGYGFYSCYSYRNLNDKYVDIKNKYEKIKNQSESNSKNISNTSKVNYINYGENYKIYAIEQHNSLTYSIVVGYNESLYMITSSNVNLENISKIASTKFDSSGNFEDKSGLLNIHKFTSTENELKKVAFSVSYSSTDGSKYPILILNSGKIETTNKETDNVLKDYNIQDFISEKCTSFDDNMKCKKGSLSYEVILSDGSKKNIIK